MKTRTVFKPLTRLNLALLAVTVLALAGCGGGGSTPSTPAPSDVWTWMGGDDDVYVAGVYGIKGKAEAANKPGSRYWSVSWVGPDGGLWLFGGEGKDRGDFTTLLNDLWRWDGSKWAWMAGSDRGRQSGDYGTLGKAADTNVPGARWGAAGWTDANGDLWLFGGLGFDGTGTSGWLNDLWRWDIKKKAWIWEGGSNKVDQPGVYGEKGVAAADNMPSGRENAVVWKDTDGNVWMFGGSGIDSAGAGGRRNDLWRWDGNMWTWMAGSDTVDPPGVYGTPKKAGAANTPGGRQEAIGWVDSEGNLWLFGGRGEDRDGVYGYLNELWRWDGSEWAWMGGSNVVDQPGVYGQKGMADAANVPGARISPATWQDNKGRLWLLGGEGVDSTGAVGRLNDLWRWDGGMWTWMGGSDKANQFGVYGIKGVRDAANQPGGRNRAASWVDARGRFWLFGGSGYYSTDSGRLNDLWRYEP